MTGKLYYMTTLGAWRRHAARFANSHFIVLGSTPDGATGENELPRDTTFESDASALGDISAEVGLQSSAPPVPDDPAVPDDGLRILVLVEADEGVHLALEDESAFEPLPHPLAQKPISIAAQSALASHGVALGSTTFDAAEAIARVHPLLRHRVF